MESKIIEDLLNDYDLINALTMSEKNKILKDINIKIEDDKSIESWLSMKSTLSHEEIFEKIKIEKLSEQDFNIAFYEIEDSNIKQECTKYIKLSEWYKFYEEALSNDPYPL